MTQTETTKDRLRLILGEEGLARLDGACVMVIGLGGVGSNCVEALARGGVGNLVLLDRDVVDGKNGLVSAYSSYEVADPDETVYAVVIVTPVLEDDSVSVMIVWCSEQGAAKYGEAIFDMMESFDKE